MKTETLTEEENKELMSQLPVFITTISGKQPTEQQLKNLVGILKKEILKKRKKIK